MNMLKKSWNKCFHFTKSKFRLKITSNKIFIVRSYSVQFDEKRICWFLNQNSNVNLIFFFLRFKFYCNRRSRSQMWNKVKRLQLRHQMSWEFFQIKLHEPWKNLQCSSSSLYRKKNYKPMYKGKCIPRSTQWLRAWLVDKIWW